MNIFKKLFERDDVGIDLGAANMRGWVRGRGLVLDEPSVVWTSIGKWRDFIAAGSEHVC